MCVYHMLTQCQGHREVSLGHRNYSKKAQERRNSLIPDLVFFSQHPTPEIPFSVKTECIYQKEIMFHLNYYSIKIMKSHFTKSIKSSWYYRRDSLQSSYMWTSRWPHFKTLFYLLPFPDIAIIKRQGPYSWTVAIFLLKKQSRGIFYGFTVRSQFIEKWN